MGDGDIGAMATIGPSTMPPPPRFCTDCAREPLAFWTLDDCNTSSAESAPRIAPWKRTARKGSSAGGDRSKAP